MNARIRYQVGLELGNIHVQGTVKAERSGQGRDDLSNQTVQVGIGGALNVQGATADVIHSFVVEHHGNVGVFEERVGGQHGVVGFDNGRGNLGGGVHGESQLGFLSIVNRQALEQQGAESRAGTASDGIEHQKALKTGTVVGQFTNAIEAKVDNFLSNGIVATSKVVGGIFLARNQLLGVEEVAIGTGPHFVNHGRFQIDKDAARDMLASTSFGEKGVESVVRASDGLVRRHGAIGLDAVFQAVELPASITDLNTGLALRSQV